MPIWADKSSIWDIIMRERVEKVGLGAHRLNDNNINLMPAGVSGEQQYFSV